MTVIVTACSSFRLSVSETQTEIMCLETKGGGKVSFTTNAAGQVKSKHSSLCTRARLSPQTETLALIFRGVVRGPGRASSGTRWKSVIAGCGRSVEDAVAES